MSTHSAASFVTRSYLEFAGVVRDLVAHLPTSTRVGIFGYREPAQVMWTLLQEWGYTDVPFICTLPPCESLLGAEVWALADPRVGECEVILTSSLAKPHVQVRALQEARYPGTVLSLPDLRHLSVSLREDHTTHQRITELAGRLAGRPAFVIGNGPSLKETDPRRISDPFVTMASNGSLVLEDFHPDQYYVVDEMALKQWPREMARQRGDFFFPARLREAVRSRVPDLDAAAVYFPLCYQQRGELDLAAWPEQGFESGHTVACPMLQFAALQGCDPIYLIGIDLDYTAGSGNHFDRDYFRRELPEFNHTQAEEINQAMQTSLQRVCDQLARKGVEVVNCSPRKSIPFLPALDFAAALERHQP
jgi:hypothetical protein